MPHLNDGELHAYLDGALDLLGERAEEVREHLRSCDACRRRLDEERRVLERSSAILESASPAEAAAPTLEELRERARAREASGEDAAEGRRWRPMPRGQLLAWAATVVLALGIGWMTRDLVTGVRPTVEPATAPVRSESPEPPGAAADEAPDRAEEPVPPPAGEATTRPEAGDRGRDDAAAGLARSRGGAEDAAAGGADQVARPAAPLERPAEEQPAEPRAVEQPAEQPAEERREAGPTVAATVVGRVVDDASLEPLGGAAVLLEDSAGVRHGGTLTGSDGRFLLRAERPGTYRAVVERIGYAGTRTDFFELSPHETVAREIRASARSVTLDAITVTGIEPEEGKAAAALAPEAGESAAEGVTAGAGPEVAGDAAPTRRMAGIPVAASLHVPELPVVGVEARPEGGGVVILQRLPRGDTLRLHWIPGPVPEEGVEESALREPLSEGWSEVVLVRAGGRLVARAPLPEDELRALLSRRP